MSRKSFLCTLVVFILVLGFSTPGPTSAQGPDDALVSITAPTRPDLDPNGVVAPDSPGAAFLLLEMIRLFLAPLIL